MKHKNQPSLESIKKCELGYHSWSKWRPILLKGKLYKIRWCKVCEKTDCEAA